MVNDLRLVCVLIFINIRELINIKLLDMKRNKTSNYLNKIELNEWLNWLKKNEKWRYYLLVKLGVSSLLRYSDLKKIKWEDILDRDRFFISEQKTGKKREIRISNELRESIKMVYNKMNDNYSDIIFPFHINSVNHYIEKSLYNSGIRKSNISTHSFRKSGGRFIWESNNKSDESILMLSLLFNHSSTSITRRYLGIEREKVQDMYRFQEEMFLV